MSAPLKIAVIEKDRDRALMIIEGLTDTGNHDVTVFGDESGLTKKLARLDPDVVLIDIANPRRDVLEELTLASCPTERPVAMFVDESNETAMKSAIEAGVSAYVVDGLQARKIKPILDAAIARFQMFKRMRRELDATKQALAERKTLDKAKGLLMKAKGLSEDEAYALLRKTAMDQGRKVVDVATALVTASDLLR